MRENGLFYREIRTPADVQDFQTSFQRSAKFGLDVTAWKDDAKKTFKVTVQDYLHEDGRFDTVAYKLYYFPYEVPSVNFNIGNASTAKAAAAAGRLIGSMDAHGGDIVTFEYSIYYGRQGYYFVTGVNREGRESSPSTPVPSPWNP